MNNMGSQAKELSDCDLKILKFVLSNGKADAESIRKALPHVEAVSLRLKRLSAQQYSQPDALSHRRPLPNTSYLICSGQEPETYQLTELGKIMVQDDKYRRRREFRLRLTNGVLLPIIVSLLTTLIVSAPKWLLPLLERLSASAP